MVGCLSIERILKAFNCNLHHVHKIACQSLCCSGEMERDSTPTASIKNSAVYEAPKTQKVSLEELIQRYK